MDEMVTKEPGTVLRNLRTRRNIALDDLAQRAGIERNTLVRIENNGYVPSFMIIKRLAKELSAPELIETFFGKEIAQSVAALAVPQPVRESLFRAFLDHFEEGRSGEELKELLSDYCSNTPDAQNTSRALMAAVDRFSALYNDIEQIEKQLPEH